jgi:hypothetical protein
VSVISNVEFVVLFWIEINIKKLYFGKSNLAKVNNKKVDDTIVMIQTRGLCQ